MLRLMRALGGTVADYTIGTIIVMAHMITAERVERRQLAK